MLNKEIKGIVIHGKGNGKKLLVPTANLEYKDDCNFEKGVFVSDVYLSGKKYIGVTNIGTRPTIDEENKSTVETHILDFDKDIYGEELKIVIKEKIRDIKKYNSIDDLKKQLKNDILEARKRSVSK